VIGFGRLFAGDAHGIISLLAVAGDGDLALDQALIAVARRLKNLRELRRDFGKRPAEHHAFGAADQTLRRTVENGDAAVGIDADDAGAGAGKHGLGEPPPAVDEIARAHDILMLGPQFLRHLVEGLAELGEVAFRSADRHLNEKIPGRDQVGGAD
jgi:hypothetical protein